MLRRCMRGGAGAQAVDAETAITASPPVDIEPVVRRLSSLATAVVAPSLAAAAAAAAAPSDWPPSADRRVASFLVNASVATAGGAGADRASSLSFSPTPVLVRLTSSLHQVTPTQPPMLPPRQEEERAAAAATTAAPAPAPALPAERRLVWTQSKARREAWLLEEAKESAAMLGLDEEGPEREEEGVFQGDDDDDGDDDGKGDDNEGEDGEGDGPFGAPEDRRRLRRRLARLGLARQRCEGDGNCLFRAVSAQLYGGSQGAHAAVRAAAVGHMLANRADYEAFLGEDFGAYAEGMARPGAWGDELALRAVSDGLGVVVHVVTSDPGARGWYHLYRPAAAADGGGSKGQGPPEIFLAYLAPVHYEGLVPAPPQQQQQKTAAAAAAMAAALEAAPTALSPRPASAAAAAICRAEA